MLIVNPYQDFDRDALDYIRRVESADDAGLETGIKVAYNNFVRGCKQDDIWDAIKASCILAGARTLNGALVPLVGAAPTNFNFVSGDYDRVNGLTGDGVSKYLNSNRNNNAEPQNNKHMAFYLSSTGTNNGWILGSATVNTLGESSIFNQKSFPFYSNFRVNNQTFSGQENVTLLPGFGGVSRESATVQSQAYNGLFDLKEKISTTPISGNMMVLGIPSQSRYSDSTISFFSIGESLDLEVFEALTTQLMSDISTALS